MTSNIPVALPQEVWQNSQLSLIAASGGAKINGKYYFVVGEQNDLVREDFVQTFKHTQRDRFYQVLSELGEDITLSKFKAALKKPKVKSQPDIQQKLFGDE
jgi:hypothetical protein